MSPAERIRSWTAGSSVSNALRPSIGHGARDEHRVAHPVTQQADHAWHRAARERVADEDDLVEAGRIDVRDHGRGAVREPDRRQRRRVGASSGQVDGDGRTVEVGEQRIPAATVEPTAVDRARSGSCSLEEGSRHGRVRGRPVGRHEAVADEPLVADRDELVAVSAVVVEAQLGDDREVRSGPLARVGDSSTKRRFVTLWRTIRVTPDVSAAAFAAARRASSSDAAPPPRNSMIASRPCSGSRPRISSTPSTQNA